MAHAFCTCNLKIQRWLCEVFPRKVLYSPNLLGLRRTESQISSSSRLPIARCDQSTRFILFCKMCNTAFASAVLPPLLSVVLSYVRHLPPIASSRFAPSPLNSAVNVFRISPTASNFPKPVLSFVVQYYPYYRSHGHVYFNQTKCFTTKYISNLMAVCGLLFLDCQKSTRQSR